MKNNKSINIYMGIIGEAYVDKETAYAVLLAAKKNILDVQAIINSANALFRPLSKASVKAEKAIDDSVQVYNKLKDAISQFEESDLKYIKLYALLSDLNENDFDDNFSNGGNIFTARENLTFAQSLETEIRDILRVAEELLDANKLNAVVRCKEYNIAKELFEAMIPEKIVSPEEISDAMEAELIRRINEVRNNIDYVDLVSDEISSISEEVSNKIDGIVDGTDSIITETNETLYWYAGNINPWENEPFMEDLGFVLDTNLDTYFYKPEYDEFGEYVKESLLKDFGIDGPLRANKWFHHPLHLIQDGQLIAGVDGGKAKESFWYIAVPRYIPTAAGSTAYARSEEKANGLKIQEWAALHSDDTDLVKSLFPAFPKDYEHIDDAHSHPNYDNTWVDTDKDNVIDDDEALTKTAWEKISITKPLSINKIAYDVWRTPVTIYNKQRLNVYFNLGQPEKKEIASGIYWYIGKNKPTYNSDVLNEEGWSQITTVPTAEAPLTYDETLDSKIFYIAIPKEFGIFDNNGVDLTAPELEAESPYTLVYTSIISDNVYNVYITGNEDAQFKDKIYVKQGQNIDIDPTPGPNTDPDTPSDPGLDPSQLTGNYWYAGPTMLTPSTNPENGPIYAMNSTNIGWHNIEGTPSSIHIGELALDHKITWIIAVPASLGLTHLSNGEDITDIYDVSYVTANGVQYVVFTQIDPSKKLDLDVISGGSSGGSDSGDTPSNPNYYWYAGADPINSSSVPGSNDNWHAITGTPTKIVTGEIALDEKIAWIVAVPTALNLNHISNGEDITDLYDVTTVTCADGIEYTVFTQLSTSKKIDIEIVN